MKGKIFLVRWDEDAARRDAEALRARGWSVDVESENGGRAYRSIRTSLPDAVVLDLRHRPTHGREVGSALRELRATKSVPILCIEEGEEAREQTRARIPGVSFTTPDALELSLVDATRERARAERASQKKIAKAKIAVAKPPKSWPSPARRV